MTAVAAAVTGLLTGCAAPAHPEPPGGGVEASWGEDCEEIVQAPVAAGTSVLTVVADGTASGRGLTAAPGVGELLAAAQADGLALVVVGVDGPGVPPPVVGPVSLDPYPGSDSVVAGRAREIALRCGAALLHRPEVAPTTPGSDVLAAVTTAVRQQPAAMGILSDGVASDSVLDPAVVGWEPDTQAVVSQLLATGADLPAEATPVTWIGLGETTTVLPSEARAGLGRLWTAVLGARGAPVTVDTRTGSTTTRDVGSLPEDVVAPPQATVVETSTRSVCVLLPSVLLFGPEETELSSTEPLRGVVARATEEPAWVVRVEGHTADFGTPEGRARVSQDRADAVAAALRSQGVTNEVVAVGRGADRPRADEWPAGPRGPHDTAAADVNRRVEIRLGDSDVVDGVPC
ncbi:OmpA family protein [Cellulomonas flavigena]|uniref:OmpA family protein n=1 Tax=Cellulomonas flavigena TaxID=1711 RepID=UPI0003180FB3|nr:OmpA family protein [Cellulomonas flavigena]